MRHILGSSPGLVAFLLFYLLFVLVGLIAGILTGDREEDPPGDPRDGTNPGSGGRPTRLSRGRPLPDQPFPNRGGRRGPWRRF